MTDLLERDDAESALHQALARARDGNGGLVLLAGEAGMGKTSLVRAFLDHAAGRPRVLTGACDPVEAPRPLGPLIDAAHDVDADLGRRLASGVSRVEAFASALDLVDADDAVTVFVLEDLHWADEATLDVFTFLGRRLERRRVLLVATFRSDEVGVRHPLRIRLADVHRYVHARIDLCPLSADAVGRLTAAAGAEVDAATVHAATGGNPFYVTEILAAGDDARGITLPSSVRDAVLARASRLPDEARVVLDAASIVPGSVEHRLLEAICGHDVLPGLDTCIDRGLLRRRVNGELEFRHELARLAIDEVIEPARRRRFHERALDALRRSSHEPDHARLALHAIEADHRAAVIEHAPIAAREMIEIGGARQAAELLTTALRYDDLLDDHRRGELWRELAHAEVLLSRYTEALEAQRRAFVAFERAGDTEACADVLARSGDALSGLARQPEFVERLRQADELLGADPPDSRAAATVASAWCSAHMLARQPVEAERAGQRAMTIARSVGDTRTLVHTAIQSGISLCMTGDDTGLERVREAMKIADEQGFDRVVALGFTQIGSGYGELRRYDVAMPALREGIAYKDERELIAQALYDHAWLARCELEIGDWDAAGRRAAALADNERCVGNTKLVVLCTLGWLRSRRGDPGVAAILDEALALGRTANHIQRLWPAATCRAEHAWTHVRAEAELDVLHEALELARTVEYVPAIEELSHWLSIIDGRPRGDPDQARTPFGLSAAGRPDLAAQRWHEVGCPFEEAFARYLTDDPDQLHQAHEGFLRLGAGPMRARVADRLRELGAPVPRGANQSTLENPHGLTDRELDVLSLLPTGVTNREIGEQLHISPKTVAHHVSHVLSKLDVRTRAEAAVVAERLGLTPP